nr:hypothetical protein [Blastococcus atacamensis]
MAEEQHPDQQGERRLHDPVGDEGLQEAGGVLAAARLERDDGERERQPGDRDQRTGDRGQDVSGGRGAAAEHQRQRMLPAGLLEHSVESRQADSQPDGDHDRHHGEGPQRAGHPRPGAPEDPDGHARPGRRARCMTVSQPRPGVLGRAAPGSSCADPDAQRGTGRLRLITRPAALPGGG